MFVKGYKSMSRYRSKVSWANLVYLLQSRRRQAVVFDVTVIMLILGVIFTLGAAFGDFTVGEIPLNLIALMISLLALYNAWRGSEPSGNAAITKALQAMSVLLVGSAVLLAAGIEITLLWSLLLTVFALVMRFG